MADRRSFFKSLIAISGGAVLAGKPEPVPDSTPIPELPTVQPPVVCQLCHKPGHEMESSYVQERIAVMDSGWGGWPAEPALTVWCENMPVNWGTMEIVSAGGKRRG